MRWASSGSSLIRASTPAARAARNSAGAFSVYGTTFSPRAWASVTYAGVTGHAGDTH